MQKKEDKASIKTTNKEEKEGKKRAREKDGNRVGKKSKFWLLRMREQQKSCLITSG